MLRRRRGRRWRRGSRRRRGTARVGSPHGGFPPGGRCASPSRCCPWKTPGDDGWRRTREASPSTGAFMLHVVRHGAYKKALRRLTTIAVRTEYLERRNSRSRQTNDMDDGGDDGGEVVDGGGGSGGVTFVAFDADGVVTFVVFDADGVVTFVAFDADGVVTFVVFDADGVVTGRCRVVFDADGVVTFVAFDADGGDGALGGGGGHGETRYQQLGGPSADDPPQS